MNIPIITKRSEKRKEKRELHKQYKSIRVNPYRRRLRVLCLHGHGSNDEITNLQLFGLKLSREQACDLEFLNAPHVADRHMPGLEQYSEGGFYTWGGKKFSKEGNSDWEESLDFLAKYLKKNGPYDGVYGFSQGVTIITAFSNPMIWKKRFRLYQCPWKFAILACGGGSWLLPNKDQTLLDIPSLHIKGKRDFAYKDSTRIEERWRSDNRESYTHKRGHEIDLRLLEREPKLGIMLHDFFDNIRRTTTHSFYSEDLIFMQSAE